jgi:hypothetical protein
VPVVKAAVPVVKHVGDQAGRRGQVEFLEHRPPIGPDVAGQVVPVNTQQPAVENQLKGIGMKYVSVAMTSRRGASQRGSEFVEDWHRA